MSVTNMNSRMAMAEKLSVPQLQQAVQSGSLPAYIGVPLIEQKLKAQKQAAVPQQQAQRPIAQEVMEEASGIASVPSNLPVSEYADGGIVAFAEGGDVDDFDYEEYLEQKEESDYEDMIRQYMAQAEAAGIEGIPINRTKKVEQKYAQGGITRLYQGGDVLERMRIDDPEGYARVMREVPQVPPGLMERSLDASGNLMSDLPLSMEDQAGMNDPMAEIGFGTTSDVRMPPTSAPTPVPTPASAPVAQIIPEMQDPGGIATVVGLPPKRQAPPTGGTRAPERAVESSRSERPKSAFDDFMADIKASREDLKKQQSQDKYMALLSAGLGMMSGTSPNAFANIGQGAQAGVASYGASQKQRAAERAALNKNLLMGQRYQSMEDIANRTADISEARNAAIAASRGAGGDSKTEAELNRQENAFTNRLRNAELSVKAGLEARFGDPKLAAMINKEEYAAAVRELNKRYVDPVIILQNQFLSKRYPSVYGDQAPAPTVPQAAPAASSGFKIIK